MISLPSILLSPILQYSLCNEVTKTIGFQIEPPGAVLQTRLEYISYSNTALMLLLLILFQYRFLYCF